LFAGLTVRPTNNYTYLANFDTWLTHTFDISLTLARYVPTRIL
jgi:hypothetical protein